MQTVQPWKNLLPEDDWRIASGFSHGLEVFEHAVATSGDGSALRYFDYSLSYAELDRQSTALAAELVSKGFRPGDRLAVYLQNVPAFLIAMIGAWKAGGTFVTINPMNRATELSFILNDAKPLALVLMPSLLEVYRQLPEDCHHPAILLCSSPLDYQQRNDPRAFTEEDFAPKADVIDFIDFVAAGMGRAAPEISRDAASPGFLVYTSGTTGVPKAAVINHGAIGYGASPAAMGYGLKPGDRVLAMAPIFHMTGLMSTMMSCLGLGGSLIIAYRFVPDLMIDIIEEHQPNFTAGAPTAFIALMNASNVKPESFKSFKALGIGGAPVPPAVVALFEKQFGITVQSGYGMTETGGAVTIVPLQLKGVVPVDQASGALSIGIPLPECNVWIADDEGRPLAPRETGEIIVQSPANMTEYWNRADATAETLRSDGLRTGDVGFMDEDGWFYLVDRKKDVIIASGYKVWPREVEDALYSHPAVLEAAVVGEADPYRGETVAAFIVPRKGMTASEEEIRAYCRQKLAAYKCPKRIVMTDTLPKTLTGKIMRRELRAKAQPSTA